MQENNILFYYKHRKLFELCTCSSSIRVEVSTSTKNGLPYTWSTYTEIVHILIIFGNHFFVRAATSACQDLEKVQAYSLPRIMSGSLVQFLNHVAILKIIAWNGHKGMWVFLGSFILFSTTSNWWDLCFQTCVKLANMWWKIDKFFFFEIGFS